MKRALVSVSDKTNLIEFVSGLKELGYEIISTGGTKKALDNAGLDTLVSLRLPVFQKSWMVV